MMSTDKDALLCDLAETYHIYDFKSLPLSRVATFSVGLRENSRIKMKMRGMDYTLQEILLASVADKLALLLWLRTKDGAKGINKPQSLLAEMLGETESRQHEVFETPEAFEKRKTEILQGG